MNVEEEEETKTKEEVETVVDFRPPPPPPPPLPVFKPDSKFDPNKTPVDLNLAINHGVN